MSAQAAVAATDQTPALPIAGAPCWGSLLAAALVLPGVVAAQDENGPGPGLVSVKWLSYQDRQPGLERIRVSAPSLLVRVPLDARWGGEASVTADSVSGASPRYHSAISGASRMSEERRAGEIKLTRFEERSRYGLALVASDERDYKSRTVAAEGRWNSEDNNRSWNAAMALTRDRIGSVDDTSLAEKRRTVEVSAGVTQALTRADLLQFNLSHAWGSGFYSDPYKRLDHRPGGRHQTIALLRWNHHVEAADVTLRSSYRSYRDSFGIRSHTLSFEPVFTAAQRFTITPGLRLYSQTAARFYFDPVYSFAGAPYPPGYFEAPPHYLSPDQRLSAFGAVTVGLKVAVQIDRHWNADLKLERYEQRGSWRVGGPGSPGLAPFQARFITWGLARTF